jgi:hypothetical protein
MVFHDVHVDDTVIVRDDISSAVLVADDDERDEGYGAWDGAAGDRDATKMVVKLRVVVSSRTGRLVIGTPMTDQQVLMWNGFSWAFGILIASFFLIGNLIGPYKVRSTAWLGARDQSWSTQPLSPPLLPPPSSLSSYASLGTEHQS